MLRSSEEVHLPFPIHLVLKVRNKCFFRLKSNVVNLCLAKNHKQDFLCPIQQANGSPLFLQNQFDIFPRKLQEDGPVLTRQWRICLLLADVELELLVLDVWAHFHPFILVQPLIG